MGEKRGNLIKLLYDFNTAWACEIYMNEKWVRVLERDFRSFNGPRRITRPLNTELGNVRVPLETVEYTGPYYYHGTNTLFNPVEEQKNCLVYMPGTVRQEAKKTAVAKI